MTVSDAGQARVFVINIILGMMCVILFDFFRALRRRRRGDYLYANILDVLFWILAFGAVFAAEIKFNFGAMRYYELMGLVIGAGVQIVLFARFEVRIFGWMIAAFEAIVKLLVKAVLFLPVRIARLFAPAFNFLRKKRLDFSRSYR
ncbi:MAG: spore cortex biosynthesis protein YabQ, partial [Clostridia bacterium]|nr:spore cortex biosynthesis protein YabQ [Clostridia bacterium]